MLAEWSILESVVCKALASLRTLGDIRNNQGYVIAEYVISSRWPMLKNRKLTEPKKSVRSNECMF